MSDPARNGFPTRDGRVQQFCDWLDSIAPNPTSDIRYIFYFMATLSESEIEAAACEMGRRVEARHV